MYELRERFQQTRLASKKTAIPHRLSYYCYNTYRVFASAVPLIDLLVMPWLERMGKMLRRSLFVKICVTSGDYLSPPKSLFWVKLSTSQAMKHV